MSFFDSDLVNVFRTVYGRSPQAEEAATLASLSVNPGNQANAFRAVIGHFDHQFRRTPFAVKFSREDVSFLRTADGFSVAVDSADGSVGNQLLSGVEYEPHVISFFK